MKTLKMLLAIALIAVVCTANAATKGDDKKDVEQAVEKLRQGMLNGDRATLESVAAEELSYGHSNGRVEDKKEFVEAFVSGTSDFKTIELTDQTVTVSGNTAWVRHKLYGETNDKGVPGTAKISILTVWVKQKGTWKLFARQAVKIQ
ncbi:nuclear transport factor 2 family protein [Arsenicibacter rosenii]|uniref:DUF4440 domain-containing protein n=1 Tax=Arsenicibacter rosenii TaxID=1750698 RepID=A0A1S2VHQ9_9BACT|nr:nuclear transport factor 2 family protein [Arsenicibacter rosenii]OIN58269.1 DUF4440 domain-containing protein [Arsenicibacter rosenii]